MLRSEVELGDSVVANHLVCVRCVWMSWMKYRDRFWVLCFSLIRSRSTSALRFPVGRTSIEPFSTGQESGDFLMQRFTDIVVYFVDLDAFELISSTLCCIS